MQTINLPVTSVNVSQWNGGACDSCFLRRVKCNRSRLPADATCDACRRRSIRCTDLRRRQRRGGEEPSPSASTSLRQLPRVSVAPETSSASPAASSSSRSRRSSVGSLSSPLASAASAISTLSPETRLLAAEQSESLRASLMDQFLTAGSFDVTIVNWENLRLRFLNAGRRISQLDAMTRPLVLATIAFGALTSDHPLIVGPNAPALGQLRTLGLFRDLSPWGQRRQPFCENLVRGLIDQLDHSGIFQVACTESVAAMAMCAALIAFQRGACSFEAGRPYWAAALAHCRAMAEVGDRGNELASKIGPYLALGDAFRSAHGGQALMCTVEDVDLLVPSPQFNRVAFTHALERLDHDLFQQMGMALYRSVIDLIRSVATTISTRIARRHPVNASDFLAVLARLHALHTDMTELCRIGQQSGSFDALDGSATVDGLRFRDSTHVVILPSFICVCGLTVKRHFAEWLQRHPSHNALQYDATVNQVHGALNRFFADALNDVTRLVQLRSANAGIEAFSFLSPFVGIRDCLQKLVGVALQTPHFEEGGPASFTWDHKSQNIQLLIDMLRQQAFVWPGRRNNADVLEESFRQLQATHSLAVQLAAPPAADYVPQQPQVPGTHPWHLSSYTSPAAVPRMPAEPGISDSLAQPQTFRPTGLTAPYAQGWSDQTLSDTNLFPMDGANQTSSTSGTWGSFLPPQGGHQASGSSSSMFYGNRF